MELETSRAIIISTPSVLCSLSFTPICGLDIPMEKKKNAIENITTCHRPYAFDTDGMSMETSAGSPSLRIFFFFICSRRAYATKKNGISNIRKRYCACAKLIIAILPRYGNLLITNILNIISRIRAISATRA